MSNAQERGEVREQLLQTQAELADARSELYLWAQNAGSAVEPAKSEGKNQDAAEQENGSIAKDEQGSELPSSVATLTDSFTELSAPLTEHAVADEQTLKI